MVGKLMQALQYHRYGGGPADLKHVEVPIPSPKKDEVLVKVRATGPNPVDWKLQKGTLRPFLPCKFPFVPGVEAFKIGDKVVSMLSTMDRGIVHVGWVQQLHILAHVSVGCYVCHAGLSSITEAVVNDCQLVLVPQKGDQFLIARLFAGDLKAGVEVNRDDDNGLFRREGLCEVIEMVMKKAAEEPGKTIRENHRKVREFLSDEETHERFTREFVEKLKEVAFGGGGGNEDLKKEIS